jgi:hypothetical protein
MPSKHKPHKPVASPNHEVWIAPRPAKTSGARILEPAGIGRSNRYLEFADIALGVKETPKRKKITSSAASQFERNQNRKDPEQNQNRKSKVTPIDSHRPVKEGFDAFRNSR